MSELKTVYLSLLSYLLFVAICSGVGYASADLTHGQFCDQYSALESVDRNLEEYSVYEDFSYSFGSDSGDIRVGGSDSDYSIFVDDTEVYHSYKFTDIIDRLKTMKETVSTEDIETLRNQLNETEL